MKTLFSLLILLLALLLAGTETALGQCTYTTNQAGNFNDPAIYDRSAPGCPALPTSLDNIIIKHQVTLNQNFTVASTSNKKKFGSITISATGSLLEDAMPRTLTIDHGILDVQATTDRSVPRLRVSVLDIAHTEQGNSEKMASIGANSAIQVTCLMISNQGGIELADNALINVAANIDVATGNGSIEGVTALSSQPAAVQIRGIFTGAPGGVKKVFSGNLRWCMEGILELGDCPIKKDHKKITTPEGGDPTCRNVLPVTLVSFTAQACPSGVKLDWVTATELNNDYFEVQRSADGRVFAAISRVSGAGTTSLGVTYSFTDTAPLAGAGYYRLRQADHDGSEAFSAVVAVIGRQQLEAIIYPNPGATTITLPAGTNQAISYRIYTTTGRTVRSGRGANGTSLDVQQIPAGLYLLELITNGQRHVQRFVRQ